jgi:hypothetical protein
VGGAAVLAAGAAGVVRERSARLDASAAPTAPPPPSATLAPTSPATSLPAPSSTPAPAAIAPRPEVPRDAPPAIVAGTPPARERWRPAEVGEVNRLALPPRGSGEGILSVNPTPWGRVFVNGEYVGDSGLELRTRAGTYRLRIERDGEPPERPPPVTVVAGRRTWYLGPRSAR